MTPSREGATQNLSKADKKQLNALQKDHAALEARIAKTDALFSQIGGKLTDEEAKTLILKKLHDLATHELNRYPGSSPRKTIQPQRGCGPCDATPAKPDGTALRFDSMAAHDTRVGLIPFGQPWAGGRKPVGLEDIKDIGISSVSRSSSIRVSGSCIIPNTLLGLRQRRFILQPRVARHALPWDIVPPNAPTATRLRPVRRPISPIGRNRVAVRVIGGTRSQGRPHYIRPTLS